MDISFSYLRETWGYILVPPRILLFLPGSSSESFLLQILSTALFPAASVIHVTATSLFMWMPCLHLPEYLSNPLITKMEKLRARDVTWLAFPYVDHQGWGIKWLLRWVLVFSEDDSSMERNWRGENQFEPHVSHVSMRKILHWVVPCNQGVKKSKSNHTPQKVIPFLFFDLLFQLSTTLSCLVSNFKSFQEDFPRPLSYVHRHSGHLYFSIISSQRYLNNVWGRC